MSTPYPYENEVRLTGYIGKEPSFRTLDSGTPVANVNLAVAEQFPDSEKQTIRKTHWFPLSFRGKTAEHVSTLAKGTLIRVEGVLHTRSFKPKDDAGKEKKERTVFEVSVSRFWEIASTPRSQDGEGGDGPADSDLPIGPVDDQWPR